jgi:hypothetical protein
MHSQLESVSKKRLQHRPHYLFQWRVSFCFCSNVVTFRIDPSRASGNLKRFDVVSILDKEPQRNVLDSQPPARLRAQHHAASALVQLDGRYLKSRNTRRVLCMPQRPAHRCDKGSQQ